MSLFAKVSISSRCILGFMACMLCLAEARAQPDGAAVRDEDSTPMREGYLTHSAKDGTQNFFFFRVTPDSLQIRAGVPETAPTVTLPALVARTAVEQMDAVAPRDEASVERIGMDLRGKTLWVRWVKQVNVFWVLATGVALGGIVVAGGVGLYVRRTRAERRRLAASRAQLAAGQEAERQRLAHELHDGPLQDLHGIRMRLAAGRQVSSAEAPPGARAGSGREAEALEEDLLIVVAELRAIMADLHPPALTPFGLGAAIRAHLDRFRLRYPHLACRLTQRETRLPLRPETSLALFRVCQEALSNAAKHADARHVDVTLEASNGRVILRIADDGRGFEPGPQASEKPRGQGPTGYGLPGMTARSEAVGAKVAIVSVVGQGTLIEVSAPLSSSEGDPAFGPSDESPRVDSSADAVSGIHSALRT